MNYAERQHHQGGKPWKQPADWVGPTPEALDKRRAVLTLKRRAELQQERVDAMKYMPWMAGKMARVEAELKETQATLGALTP